MTELPRLTRDTVPDAPGLDLPEKAVQFGTGAFLRGFVEYFIEAANLAGSFGGRIVAIASTATGRVDKINVQNGLYTLATRGVIAGVPCRENRLITSLSRALAAAEQWDEVLACSRNPALELVFSNTTEAGIRIDADDAPGPAAPASFPSKLTRFLYERAVTFDYSRERGVTVLPCELIEDNGDRLRQAVLATAARWQLGMRFVAWLDEAVPFCSTLVDRIVPGTPPAPELHEAWQELGYRDDLLTAAEPYALFAIQPPAGAAARLPFAAADANVIVAADISPYRERKLRLLNGTHTIMVPLAVLAGCRTVTEAVADDTIGAFARHVLFAELVPSVRAEGAAIFAKQLLDRFANPYVQHALTDITLQQTAKLRVRIVPAILDHAARTGRAPEAIATGFAAYLMYLLDRPGERPDDQADHVRGLLRSAGGDVAAAVRRVCADGTLWGSDLTRVPAFADHVTRALETMMQHGVRHALDQQLAVRQGALS